MSRLSLHDATEELSRMLAGASLDQLTAFSVQASLRFVSDRVRVGRITFVDVTFTCDADVVRDGQSEDGAGDDDFFQGRSRFLARTHELIGTQVERVTLRPNGALAICLGKSQVVLRLSGEDREADDWAWKVGEGSAGEPGGGLVSVACVPLCADTGFFWKRALARTVRLNDGFAFGQLKSSGRVRKN